MKPDDSRRVFEGKQVSVEVERWGKREREIVRHPGAVVIVAVDAEGRVTLVRQLREPDEEPLATARRELEEEAGLAGGDWRLAATFYSTPGFCDELVRLYFAEGVEETERALQEDEEIELLRVPLNELEAVIPEIEDAKTLAGLLLYLRER